MELGLEELAVNLRITQLKARYCRYVDFQDWAALRGLLADEAVFVFPHEVVYGADAFVERLVRLNAAADVHTVHHLHVPDILLTGERTAQAWWPLFDYSDKAWHEAGRRESHTAYSYYFERYVQDDAGNWLISHWELHRLRVDVHPPDLFAHPTRPAALPRG